MTEELVTQAELFKSLVTAGGGPTREEKRSDLSFLIPKKLAVLAENSPLTTIVIPNGKDQYGIQLKVECGPEKKQLFYVHMETFPDTAKTVHVSWISVDEAFQQKGIAAEFYKQLKPIAQEAGFRFVTGEQAHKANRDIFAKMGRFRYSDVKMEFRSLIFSRALTDQDDPDNALEMMSGLSVGFLYDHDKELMVEMPK